MLAPTQCVNAAFIKQPTWSTQSRSEIHTLNSPGRFLLIPTMTEIIPKNKTAFPACVGPKCKIFVLVYLHKLAYLEIVGK